MTLACLTLPELAARLRKKPEWLYRHWQDLVKDHDFPAPIKGLGQHRVWHQDAVEAWLQRQWPEALQPQETTVELTPIDWAARARENAGKLLAGLDEDTAA